MEKLIIWDWNGTILNDVDACIRSVNILLEKRNLDTIDTDIYRGVFGFPLINYYNAIGFDLERERFDTLAGEFYSLYLDNAKASGLQEGVTDALHRFMVSGYSQIILSAMESNGLKQQVSDHNLDRYFDEVIGLDNNLAHGKIDSAREYFQKTGNHAEKIMIGDTYHDFEVAAALGCRCILVDSGHQDLERFKFNDDTTILNSLQELTME